jgi:PAS domain S-box-containing protein/diguanylate cyclase (GGDEF)-like protein
MNSPQQFRHVIIIEDQKDRRVVYLENESTYSIGRDPNSSIIIHDNQVSRYHATLLRIRDTNNNYCYRIIDGNLQGKRSTNGLIINGRTRISHDLKHGDTISFGGRAKATYNRIIANTSGRDILRDFSRAEERLPFPRPVLGEESKKTTVSNGVQRLGESTPDRAQEGEKAQENLVRLASFPELSPNPIVEIDYEGNITYINPAASLRFKSLYQTKIQHPILTGLIDQVENKTGSLFVRELKIGQEVFEQYIHYLPESKLIRSYIFDYSRRKQMEVALRESELRYRSVIKQLWEGLFLIDAATKKVIEANTAYCNLLNYSSEEILNKTIYDLAADSWQTIDENLENILTEKKDFVAKKQHKKSDGSLVDIEVSISPISYGEKAIFCFVVRDLTSLNHLEETLKYGAFHDLLTNLPNQRLFKEQLVTAIANASRHGNFMAVMFVEIENYQEIKEAPIEELDTNFIPTLGQLLKSCLRSGDTIARWEETKFIVLLPLIKAAKDTANIGKRIIDILKQPVEIKGQSIQVKVVVGISVYPLDGGDADTLIQKAVTSREQVQKQGSNNYGNSSLMMTAQTSRLLRLENTLYNALKQEQFLLYYQPQVNIKTGQITGIEALLRWQHPELGLISPAQFIHLAEETEVIIPLGKWVLQTACTQNKLWQNEGICNLPITVNLSLKEFQQSDLTSTIAQILQQTGLPPEHLELDITEGAIIQNLEFAQKTINDLKCLGVRIALDDFGSGNSSLSCLTTLKLDTLKIAQDFISEIKDSSQDKSLLSAIIGLGRGFNLRVVAEGVEKDEDLDLLRSLGCDEVQGYRFSPPVSRKDLMVILQSSGLT